MTAPKTEKLYLNDPYCVSFRARVLEWEPGASGRDIVTLDRTCLYPESGGQTADHGSIGSYTVADVQEGEGEAVLHTVEVPEVGERPAVGDEVDCSVDWQRRFDHMQQHTGQHVLSRAFIQAANLHTVSFHLGEDSCTIDLDGPGCDDDIVRRAEDVANAIVVENRPVFVRTLPASELEKMADLELRRSLPEGVTEARLVEVEDFDVIPCCGTHVRSTGELGLIKVIKSEKAKGYRRIHFKAGGRALLDYRKKHDIVQTLGGRLTTSAEDITAKVDKLMTENQRAKRDSKRLYQALAEYETKSLLEDAAVHSGTRIVARYFPDRGEEFLRMVSTALKAEPATVVVIGAAGGSVVCSAADNVAVDFAAIAVDPARAAGGSGGGKGGFAQLRLPAGVDVSKFVEEIAENVKRSLS